MLDIIKALFVLKMVSESDVEEILDDLEKKDGMIIRSRNRIFDITDDVHIAYSRLSEDTVDLDEVKDNF